MYVVSLVITGGDNSGTVACDEVPNSNSKFVSVFTIKRPKGSIAARARGVLMVNILNKCILSILVYNLFSFRERNLSMHHKYLIHRYIGCLHEIEIQIVKKYGYLIG